MRFDAILSKEIAIHEELVFIPRRGMIRLYGPDALSFVCRMSTNKLMTLKKDHPIATVFVDNKGHIIDHCLVFLVEENHLVLISSQEDALNLLAWLEQFHFVEDFIAEETYDHEFSFVLSSQESHSFKTPFMKYWQTDQGGNVLTFYAVLNHSFPNQKVLGEEEWQTLRIKALMPLYPSEINQKWMPQNVGLKKFISDDKGCYIGQEVISKALTYQKNVKNLCGLKLSLEEFRSLKMGALVKDSVGRIGEITAIAPIYWPEEFNVLLIEGIKTSDGKTSPCAGVFEPKMLINRSSVG